MNFEAYEQIEFMKCIKITRKNVLLANFQCCKRPYAGEYDINIKLASDFNNRNMLETVKFI